MFCRIGGGPDAEALAAIAVARRGRRECNHHLSLMVLDGPRSTRMNRSNARNKTSTKRAAEILLEEACTFCGRLRRGGRPRSSLRGSQRSLGFPQQRLQGFRRVDSSFEPYVQDFSGLFLKSEQGVVSACLKIRTAVGHPAFTPDLCRSQAEWSSSVFDGQMRRPQYLQVLLAKSSRCSPT